MENTAENQQRFELRITAQQMVSTDKRFSPEKPGAGDNYKPLSVYFQKADGQRIYRNRAKGEQKCSNQTLPRLCFQIFESQIAALSAEEKEQFPICQYDPKGETICGIFTSLENYKKYKNSLEYSQYFYDEDRKFVIYSWNVFSTLLFVQECLKRFGNENDCFVLTYREKTEKEKLDKKNTDPVASGAEKSLCTEYQNPYSQILLDSKNIILRGAPGTGKSYLAKEIAADIVSNGYYDDYAQLSDEQKQQIEFVQFHPSYDYSDFVEGLRPTIKEDGSMGFELQSGIFKRFVERARRDGDNAQKKYIFIIDEINRGEISKIFGELFFSIDPGYRGRRGEVSTQYSNLHDDPNEKFYIPENLYIIGTMNDIDRSVDSFDFAMRRRFRFIPLRADDRLEMLDSLEDEELKQEAIDHLTRLNEAIVREEELNENYQIGASYFLQLKHLTFYKLWTDYLEPLLQEYVHGMYDEKEIMKRFALAYFGGKLPEGNDDGTTQN